jgi:hypothetical protein
MTSYADPTLRFPTIMTGGSLSGATQRVEGTPGPRPITPAFFQSLLTSPPCVFQEWFTEQPLKDHQEWIKPVFDVIFDFLNKGEIVDIEPNIVFFLQQLPLHSVADITQTFKAFEPYPALLSALMDRVDPTTFTYYDQDIIKLAATPALLELMIEKKWLTDENAHLWFNQPSTQLLSADFNKNDLQSCVGIFSQHFNINQIVNEYNIQDTRLESLAVFLSLYFSSSRNNEVDSLIWFAEALLQNNAQYNKDCRNAIEKLGGSLWSILESNEQRQELLAKTTLTSQKPQSLRL